LRSRVSAAWHFEVIVATGLVDDARARFAMARHSVRTGEDESADRRAHDIPTRRRKRGVAGDIDADDAARGSPDGDAKSLPS